MEAERLANDPMSELTTDEQVLIMLLLEQLEPTGARVGTRLLAEVGVQSSEASVSRMLARTDELGITRPIGKKGRVLTSWGKRITRQRTVQLQQVQNFERALELRSADELLDWLRARRLLEGEAAYLAALRLDDAALERLEQRVWEHERSISDGKLVEEGIGMDLHRELANSIDSPVFRALIESLSSPSLANIERAMDLIVVDRGTADDSIREHKAVVDAIRRGEPEQARTRMREHFERLENDVRHYCSENVITNLLLLADRAHD